MMVQDRKIMRIADRVRRIRVKEAREANSAKKFLLTAERWALMLYHEYLRRDLQVRAESLAFLMGMSILPLIAGAFLIFTVFAQFGMVSDALQGAVDRFLVTIPDEHREFVRDYIIRFKDVYLATVSKRSGSIGIFALFFLVFIGVQAFSNVDRTINFIWSTNRDRPFLETVRNFLVVSVAAPLVLIAGLSIPIILNRIAVSKYVFDQVPLLFKLLNTVVAPALIFFTFAMMYRFVPVQRVYWKSALIGATFSTVFLELSNSLMAYYFRFGTVSAYGKAAVVPLIGFWIFIVWIVVILGAEVSFLLQNSRSLFDEPDSGVSFFDGKLLLRILAHLRECFAEGLTPPTCAGLAETLSARHDRVLYILCFLVEKKLAIEALLEKERATAYVLARNIDELSLAPMLREFYEMRKAGGTVAQRDKSLWDEGLKHWLSYFEGKTILQS